MPHLTIEYSGNLDARLDLSQFCDALHAAMLATGLFETGAVRVRALPARAYAIADRLAENAFVDMSLRVGQGRSPSELKAAGEQIYAAARQALEPLFATPHFALSFEIREIDPKLSWKTNAIHPRLRGH